MKGGFLVRRMPGHFKRYSGCRGLVRRMPPMEQTRIGCHELKSKTILSYSLIMSYFSDEHISTFNISPESRRTHSPKSVRVHHLTSLVSNAGKNAGRGEGGKGGVGGGWGENLFTSGGSEKGRDTDSEREREREGERERERAARERWKWRGQGIENERATKCEMLMS